MPRYGDNPAMAKWYIPDRNKVQDEYDGLIHALHATGKAKVFEANFPNAQDLQSIRNIQAMQEEIKRIFGYNAWMVNPNGRDLVDKNWEFTQHDFVFVRDSSLSNQKDKILISSFSSQERKIEELVKKEVLENICQQYNIERKIITAPPGCQFEWGNFRYIVDEDILFAGEKQRNNLEGVKFVKEEFEVRNDKLLMIDGNGFHLDTYFSAVTWDDGKLIAGIICPHLVGNMQQVKDFFKKHKKILLEVDDDFGIGKNGDGTGNFATNTLQLKDYLIGCHHFDDNIENILESWGIKRIITPMGEYNRSWGGPHCATTQL